MKEKKVKKTRILFLAILVAGFFMTLAIPKEGNAVPSFARQQEQSCTLCHWVFPKLNESGADFKFRGYRFKPEEGKDVWAFDTWPISVVGELEGFYNDDTRQNGVARKQLDLKVEEVELMFAAPLGRRWSAFGEAAVEYDEAEDMYETMVETLFFTYHFYDDGKLNVRVGQFPIEFTYLTNKVREIIHQRFIATNTLGFLTVQKGIEINGQLLAPKGSQRPTLRYYLGLVRGEAESTGAKRGFRNPSWYGTLEANHKWMEGLSQNLGLHYGQGREDRGGEGDIDASYLTINTEISYKYEPLGDFKLLLAYWQKDEEDWTGATRRDVKYPTFTAGLSYMPTKQIVLSTRWDSMEIDSDDSTIDGGRIEWESFNVTYYFTPNIYLGLEYRMLNSGVKDIGTGYPSTSGIGYDWDQTRARAFLVGAF